MHESSTDLNDSENNRRMQMKKQAHSTEELAQLSEQAAEAARARKQRVLSEHELEHASGGIASGALAGRPPIIWGMISPYDPRRSSPI